MFLSRGGFYLRRIEFQENITTPDEVYPWLKRTTLVDPGHRRLANQRRSEL